MTPRFSIQHAFIILSLAVAGGACAAEVDLAVGFARPPDTARPWLVGYWLDGNISKPGITADLEAMKHGGIGGFSFMDCGLDNPRGPHRFMSESWREMFRFMLSEAERLGLQIDVNDGPGWAGSGGPWIKPEQAAQRIIVSETVVEGPSAFSGALPRPEGVSEHYYGDIAVLAYPSAAGKPTARIAAFDSTKSFAGVRDFAGVVPWPRFIATNTSWPAVASGQAVSAAAMVNLTARLSANGELRWDVPKGRWLVLRIGHTIANGGIRAGQPEAQGLECDKMSRAGIEAQFAGMVAKLKEDATGVASRALVSTHIDSWESGSGNWTPELRNEFWRRRGYDMTPYLPTLNGVIVDTLEISERFLWDLRETIAELVLENYAGHFRTLAHQAGLRLSLEGYDGTVDDLRYAGRGDEPMGEFWQRPIYSGSAMGDLADEMVSAAHVYGKPIVGAEAFTSIRGDYLDHPALLKPLADWSFCCGINRLYLSEWVMQPWPNVTPGVSFHQFGTVFNRAQPWWPLVRPWTEYLTRCQFMLRQGRPVADICYVAPEGAPSRFTAPIPATRRGLIPDRPPYNYDGCPAELLLDPATHVDNGAVVLPSGARYRVVVLPTYDAGGAAVIRLMEDEYHYQPAPMPKMRTMTPELLGRVKQLAEAGALVVGPRPLKSPSLTRFPDCDREVESLADEIWGTGAGREGSGEHKIGRGRVIWGADAEDALRRTNLPPDFEAAASLRSMLNYTHRMLDNGLEVYFVANKSNKIVNGNAFFRVVRKQPEFWWPESGQSNQVLFHSADDSGTTIAMSLRARESVFVVFRPAAQPGQSGLISSDTPNPAVSPRELALSDDQFTLAAWVKPTGKLQLPHSVPGGWDYGATAPSVAGSGFQTYSTQGAARRGFSVGSNGVVVFQYGDNGRIEPLLVYEHAMIPPAQAAAGFGNGIAETDVPAVLVGVVYEGGVPKLYLDGRLVVTGPANRFPDKVAVRWEDRQPFAGDLAAMGEFEARRRASGDAGQQPEDLDESAIDFGRGEILRSGSYSFRKSNGESLTQRVQLPASKPIVGPWDVAFTPQLGEAVKVQMDQLEDWAQRTEPALKYYSGIASYRTHFTFTQRSHPGERVYLDLGRVAVMAKVTLNGKPLGTAWRAPYRIDVTEALQAAGDNSLEVKVANLWVNRIIGDEQLPPDREYAASGALKAWPEWLLQGKPSPTGRQTFASRMPWHAGDKLVESGLIGPVRLVFTQRIDAD
jgi:hypothetical protein